jgi:hypothetical protein
LKFQGYPAPIAAKNASEPKDDREATPYPKQLTPQIHINSAKPPQLEALYINPRPRCRLLLRVSDAGRLQRCGFHRGRRPKAFNDGTRGKW